MRQLVLLDRFDMNVENLRWGDILRLFLDRDIKLLNSLIWIQSGVTF